MKFLFIAAIAFWCCVRLWPYSSHYAVLTVVTFAIALPFATLTSEAAFESWEIKAFLTVLLGWTAAGLIDLVLLFRALPHRPEDTVTADA